MKMDNLNLNLYSKSDLMKLKYTPFDLHPMAVVNSVQIILRREIKYMIFLHCPTISFEE